MNNNIPAVDTFEIDSMVIGKDFTVDTAKNGMRGVIFEPLQYVNAKDAQGNMVQAYCYMVHWIDRTSTFVQPANLRLAPEAFDQAVQDAAGKLFARLRQAFPFEKVRA